VRETGRVEVPLHDEETPAPLDLDLALGAHRKREKALGQADHCGRDVT
jgi:hypothetical protein